MPKKIIWTTATAAEKAVLSTAWEQLRKMKEDNAEWLKENKANSDATKALLKRCDLALARSRLELWRKKRKREKGEEDEEEDDEEKEEDFPSPMWGNRMWFIRPKEEEHSGPPKVAATKSLPKARSLPKAAIVTKKKDAEEEERKAKKAEHKAGNRMWFIRPREDRKKPLMTEDKKASMDFGEKPAWVPGEAKSPARQIWEGQIFKALLKKKEDAENNHPSGSAGPSASLPAGFRASTKHCGV